MLTCERLDNGRSRTLRLVLSFGAAISHLRVQQVSKFELFINPHTAKALGLTVSDKMLTSADEVLE
jgi:ABC-type uncharacterized transport system substrate-binding protein